MTEHKDVFAYITAEKNNWRTARVPLTGSKDWNMYEHIERCTNVANGWFHKGNNDGLRPYDDIVTPVINVAFRSEGFNVSDIVPFVNEASEYYKSFLIKKYHPQWARKHELDTFIDEVVETSIIYDLVLVKNVNDVRPEVVDLKSLAFCNQIDVLAGPICIQHDFTPGALMDMAGKWDEEQIKQAIVMATEERKIAIANDRPTRLPTKNIEVFELRGSLPERWLKEDGDMLKHVPQMHIVCFYSGSDGSKNGITLYKGVDKPLTDNFKALKIDQVRSRGRACGKSIVETLFEPQVWNNYAGIKIKELLDSAINVLVTDSDEIGNKKLTDLKNNTVLKQERGATTSRLDGSLQNMGEFSNYQQKQSNDARVLGSASEAALGKNPNAGTPFALQSLIVQEGQGIHDYRQGKISTFFADVLYRDWILQFLVDDMNKGKDFSEELTLDELQQISESIVTNEVNREIMDLILDDKDVTPEIQAGLTQLKKEAFMKGGNRRFMKVLAGELKDLPMDVYVNIKSKQRHMAENADRITNVIRQIIANPGAIQQIPGIGKAFNELFEESGMSPIDFSQITAAPIQQPEQQQEPVAEPQLAAV